MCGLAAYASSHHHCQRLILLAGTLGLTGCFSRGSHVRLSRHDRTGRLQPAAEGLRYLYVSVEVDTVKDIPARRLPDRLGFVVIAGPTPASAGECRMPESTGSDPVL
jgi:hypothetical protein